MARLLARVLLNHQKMRKIKGSTDGADQGPAAQHRQAVQGSGLTGVVLFKPEMTPILGKP